MKRLYLMRHSKTEKTSENSDISRKLTESGKSDAANQGDALTSANLPPSLIICSEAVRARETAEIAASQITPRPDIIISSNLYHADAQGYLSVIKELCKGISCMLIAHNPAMEELAAVFDRSGRGMTTSEIAWFDFDINSWKDLTPGTLPAEKGRIKKIPG